MDEVLPAVREALKRTTGPGALGSVQPGERVLLVIPADQDPMILDAALRAFVEKGVQVIVKYEHEVGVSAPPEQLTRTSISEGWKEVLWKEPIAAMLHPSIGAQRPKNIHRRVGLKAYLDDHPEYTAVIVGHGAGSLWRQQLAEHGKKFRNLWLFRTYEDLLSRVNQFPSALWSLIEDKIVQRIPQVAEARLSDPQGTCIQFRVTEEEARLWAEGAHDPGMLMMCPVSASRRVVQIGLVTAAQEQLLFPKINGVIAGTANNAGYFPHMIAHVADGVVTRIEGGGLFGELLREVMAKTRDVHYPRHPRPGYHYVNEMSLGTHPKVFRQREGMFDTIQYFPNNGQRHRSGAIKWGIGVHSHHPEVRAFAEEHRLPVEHGWHVYNSFPTFEVGLRSGQWLTLIDQGHLTALDDPEVRALAGRHGDPDELLGEDWFPAIPGINYPGDYMQDYGQDPARWVRKENEGRLPATIGVPRPS